MNIDRADSDPPGRPRELTMSESGRDSLHRDHRTGGPSLSCVKMGTIVHHTVRVLVMIWPAVSLISIGSTLPRRLKRVHRRSFGSFAIDGFVSSADIEHGFIHAYSMHLPPNPLRFEGVAAAL